MPVISQTYGAESGLNATGLTDITLSDALAVKTSWGRIGAGPCFGFPTVTATLLGSGKWTAGPEWYFLMITPVCTLDCKNDQYTVPAALGFGKAFAKNVSAFIMPEYIVSGPTRKSFVSQFNLNMMF